MSKENSNPYNEYKWGVLVSGPCNVLAAHSFDEAVEKANEINNALVKFSHSDLCNENYPAVFAQVAIWSDISNGDHDPENTIWENACA